MRQLTIDRSIWLRGEPGDSYLLRDIDQKMCCVGIYLEACGVSRDLLLQSGAAHTYKVQSHLPEEAKWLTLNDSRFPSEVVCSLYKVNDATCISEDEREAQIQNLFLKGDVEVKFVN